MYGKGVECDVQAECYALHGIECTHAKCVGVDILATCTKNGNIKLVFNIMLVGSNPVSI